MSTITSLISYLCLLRYIFFADKVEIQDITKKTCLFALAGPKSNQVRSFFKHGEKSYSILLCLSCIEVQLYFSYANVKNLKQIMSKLNLGDLIGQPYGKHQHYCVSPFFFFNETDLMK